MEEPLALWKETLMALEKRLPKSQIEAWITPLRPLGIYENTLVLGTGSELQRSYLVWNCQGQIEEALRQVQSLPLGVRFELDSNLALPAVTQPVIPTFRPAPLPEDSGVALNLRYTFDTFVVGNSNRFAHAASLGVAENPGRSHNPLFLYGGVGLGKTHLLHAVGHYFRAHFPGKRMVHTTCERFTNNMIESLRDQNMADFRRKYRQADLLLIDDIQFLQGREATQEEFFHTFNDLYSTYRQIVMTSDSHPNEIKLEERLKSRFQGGLVADLQPPDVETRIAILKKKALSDDLPVPEDVLVLIAEAVPSNIRELEGALNRVYAFSSLTGRPIDIELAREAIRDVLSTHRPAVTFERVRLSVARFFSIEPSLLSERTRTDAIVYPRQLAMYLCREILGSSYMAIGDQFGGRDHSTVLYSIDKIRNMMATDQQVTNHITEIRKIIDS